MNELIKLWLKPSTYDVAIYTYGFLPFIIVPALFVVNAPYGRFAGKFGIDWSLPGRWSWSIMELISPTMFISSTIITRPTGTPFQVVLISLWIIHYTNRAIIYPIRATSMAPIHVITFVCSIFFNLLNGYTNGMWIGRHSNSIDSTFWLGVSLWFAGFASNIHHDNILFRLRTLRKDNESKRYFIPHGGLFEWISCPNYFSETLEWLGYAIATHGSVPSVIFFIATIANLFPRAWRTHGWYKNQFNNYPPNRKAVVPFFL